MHESHQPNEDARILSHLAEDWKEFARENWDAIFAAQWAETQMQLKPLTDRTKTWGLSSQDETAQTPEKARPVMTPEDQTPNRPLIDGVADMPHLPDAEMRRRACEDISARPTLATARDIAGRIYVDPVEAVGRIVARYQSDGDRAALLSELERDPGSFGALRGTTDMIKK